LDPTPLQFIRRWERPQQQATGEVETGAADDQLLRTTKIAADEVRNPAEADDVDKIMYIVFVVPN